MIPLRDDNPSRITPLVTISLVVACVIVFVWQLSLGGRGDQQATYSLGLIPSVLFGIHHLPPALVLVPPAATIFTSMFLHGGWMHIIGNMLYLWIFGDNVEEVLGHVRYLLVYLACGLAASVAHIALAPDSLVPTLGASGAIAGVMGMYLIWFPNNQVRVLAFRTITWMPALLVIGLWIVLQLVLGMGELSTAGQQGGVAYAAHVGGATAGIIFGLVYRDRCRVQSERPSDLGWAPPRYRSPQTRYPYR